MSSTPIADGLERLSTTTSRSGTPTPQRQDGSADATSKVLQVPKGPAPHEARLQRTLKPIHGLLPHDEPLEHDATLSDLDRRIIGTLSIRYRCINFFGILSDCPWQDQIKRSVWTHLRQLLPDDLKQQKSRPSVVFEKQQNADGKYSPCIDIALPTVKTFLVVRSKLDVIEVKSNANQTLTFVQHNWQNTLPPNVLPFDILRFPLAEASLDVFFASVKHMAIPIGTALGAGLVYVSEGESSEEASSANTIRVYIELTRDGMELKAQELVNHLPSKFKWKGAAYTCHFAGQKLQHRPKVSASYPVQQERSTSAPASAAAPVANTITIPATSASYLISLVAWGPAPDPATAQVPAPIQAAAAAAAAAAAQTALVSIANASVRPIVGPSVGTRVDAGTASTSQAVPVGTPSTSQGFLMVEFEFGTRASTRASTRVGSSTARVTSSGASRSASSGTQRQEEGGCAPA